jgi:hypothetical protein
VAKAKPPKPISPKASSAEQRPKAEVPKISEVIRQRLAAGSLPVLTAHYPTVTIRKRRGRPPQLSKKHEAAARDELRRCLAEDYSKVLTRDRANDHILGWLKAKHDVEVKASTVRDRVITPIFHERAQP